MNREEGRFFELVRGMVGRLVAHPWLALAIVLSVTVVTSWWGMGIEIRSDMEDLFPDHTPNVVRARQAREIVGSRKEVQVLIGGPNREVNREVGAELAEAFAKHTEMIASVEFQRDTAFFEKNALLFVPIPDLEKLEDEVSEAIKQEVRKELALDDDDFGLDDDEDEDGGEVEDSSREQEEKKSRIPSEEELKKRYNAQDLSAYFESPDGQVLSVKVYPDFKAADTSRTAKMNALLQADIDAALAKRPNAGLSVTMEGDYSQVTAAVAQITDDLTLATLVALAGISLILIVYFRRLRAVVLVLVPLVVGIGWTFFFARATIGYLNLITAFIFAILVGLGIDFVVHGASRVDEEFAAGKPLRDALPSALARLGRAMLAAALTTMATFAALMVFDFRGFSQFGLLAAGGVMLCLLAVYVVLPPLTIAMDRIVPRAPKPARAAGAAGASGGTLDKRLAAVVLVGFAAAAAIAVASLPDLVFEGDMRKLRSETPRAASELKQKYRREAETRTASPALVITEGLEATEKVHRWLEEHAKDIDVLDEFVSIFTFVPDNQQQKLAIIKEIKRKIDNKYGALEGEAKEDADRLREYLEPAPFGVGDLPRWVKEKFTDTGGILGRYVLLYANGVKANADDVVRIQKAIGKLVVDGRTYYSTASYFITGDAYTTVRAEGPLAVGLASLVVLLLLILDLRSPRRILIAYVPLLTGFVIFLGVLSVFDIPLNLFNIVVLPTIFGIGVDTAIHLVHRLDEGGTIGDVLRTTGAAAAVSSATTAMGFYSLTFVSNRGLQSIGWVAVIGIACTFVTCTTMVSALVSLGVVRRN